MTIRQLIDELRAASDVVGADADVELHCGSLDGVKTSPRSAIILATLRESPALLRIQGELTDSKSHVDELKGAIEDAITSIEKRVDAAVIIDKLSLVL